MKDYLKLIRIKHWFKNILIFFPMFFSGKIFSLPDIVNSLIGFLLFSLLCSVVYVTNDLKDKELDRKHVVKKNRPIASGRVKPSQAIILMIALFVVSTALGIYLFLKTDNAWVFGIPYLYLAINILYTFWLKNHPILDVIALASGFLLRVLYGGVLAQVEISNWLYLMILFGALYMCLGKRRNEMLRNGKDGRKVLQYYNKEFIDKNMYVFLSLALVAYSLWCVDPVTLNRVGNNLLIWSVPLVVIILLRYSLNIEGNSHGDPIDVIFKDKELLFYIFIYALYMFGIIYA